MSLSQEEKAEIIAEFATHEGDTGSAQVQIALLTRRINGLIEHQNQHRHDYHSRAGLLKLVGQRRRLLKYLRNTEPEEYTKVIQRLGLRR